MLKRNNLGFSLVLLILLVCLFLQLTTSAPETCDIHLYKNFTSTPTIKQDESHTCPEGYGSRAFVEAPILVSATEHVHGEPDEQKHLREVMPDELQAFHCLANRKCYLIVRGFGLGTGDAIAVLPLGSKKCPPNEKLSPEVSDTNNVAVVIRADKEASLASNRYAVPVASFAAFELSEKLVATPGEHTICYAPALASPSVLVEDLDEQNFHYNAGTLKITDNLLDCTFEEPLQTISEEGGFGGPKLPCGFRNFRDAFLMDLVWKMGQNETDTPGTGPHHDATPGSNGQGHYVFMDSPGYSLGESATLVSPPVAFPKGGYCVQFAYHMHGADIATLRSYIHEVVLKDVKGHTGILMGDWGSPKWVAVGNKGDVWHHGGFEFRADDMQAFQIVFEAVAGRSEEADIAIDDVKITPGRCPPEIKHHFPKTLSALDGSTSTQPMVCGEVRLKTGTHSPDKSWHVEGAISCAGRGYTLDNLNSTSWVPCCVPHFGVYNLVLEDGFGDGWTGSTLEFRFFDRVIVFGDDEFQSSGFHKRYNLIIGSLEIVDIAKPDDTSLVASVRIARPKSYAWCGVVKAGKNGKPLAVKFTADTLKKYGVRSARRSNAPNEVIEVHVRNVLKPNSLYDMYCYSEVTGLTNEVASTEDGQEQIRKEILASRIRVSTDREPPKVTIANIEPTYNTINVTISTSESGVIWCIAEKADQTKKGQGVSGDKPLEDSTKVINWIPKAETDADARERLIKRFKEYGTEMEVTPNNDASTLQQSMFIAGLTANTRYNVFCYAEDNATPHPNSLTPAQIGDTMKLVKTQAKVPAVTIIRRVTLLRGFKLYVKADAPGRVWCAAAPADYGIPTVEDVTKVGATADVSDPSEQATLEVRGVEPNTEYVIFCVGGLLGDTGDIKMTSEPDEMQQKSIQVISYGKYCEVDLTEELTTTTDKKTPFHPISAEEELAIRDYMLQQKDLNLDGIYRINILPNKTEIYDYYENGAPKPLRYARVRAGRCEGGVGYYEQFRVGPLENRHSMTYQRIARPVKTECGGYNPQGVFGRRLLDATTKDSLEFNRFLQESFGHEFETEACKGSAEAASEVGRKTGNKRNCLELGPLILEEPCKDESKQCDVSEKGGRIWIGMRTLEGDRLPFYFIHNISEEMNKKFGESPQDWAKRVIHDGKIPEGFESISEATEVWYEGKSYPSIDAMLNDQSKVAYTPESFKQRRQLMQDEMRSEGKRQIEEQRRRLDPQPWGGAAGTAGPLPSRLSRRGDLEYKAIPEHVEPQGRRYTVEASTDQEAFTIKYSGWSMTVTNDRDTGLRIYRLRFLNQNIAFEIGLMEALAHYSVSERNWFFLDSWYGGLGAAARRVHKGIECPKIAASLFFDGSLCVFEQDMARPIRAHWKSGELRDAAPHTALVLRQMLTVSNYDYVTDYRFHSTGMFEGTVAFTGELYAGIEVPWYSARQKDYGVQVTGAMRFAALHTHMAVWKIDFDIGQDFGDNSVLLTEVIPDPLRQGAHKLNRTFVETEHDAAWFKNDTRLLIYEVVDEKIRIFENTGGIRLIPGPGVNPINHKFELYTGPAAWGKYKVASTVRKYGEADSTLPRDNKFASQPAVSLDRYIADDEPLRHVDVVTWVSDGIYHVPVVEDMPQTIPIGNTLGWLAKPSNIFYEDPSMDLRNALGGGVEDPGTCAVVRLDIAEVEPTLQGCWRKPGPPPIRENML